jgi:hypothetical protein
METTTTTTTRIEFTQEFEQPLTKKELRRKQALVLLELILEKSEEVMEQRGNLDMTPEQVLGTFTREYREVEMALYENNPFKFYREMADLFSKGIAVYVLCQEKTLCFTQTA